VITRSLCNLCLQVYEIHSEPSDAHLLKEVVNDDLTCACPRLCGGYINILSSAATSTLATDPRLKAPMHLTAKELFRAVKGGGLPDEVPKSEDVIALLFQASKVVDVRTQTLGNRVYLNEIHFENGQVLHLSSGLRGAEVLKITKRAP
jgi:hypothetical protein